MQPEKCCIQNGRINNAHMVVKNKQKNENTIVNSIRSDHKNRKKH